MTPSHHPLSGIKYILTHPRLLGKVLCVACIGIVVALTILILLLVFVLQPQAEAFGGSQWWSWLLAVIAVLLEAAIAAVLVLVAVQSKCRKEVFVETMRLEGRWKEGEMSEPSIAKDINCCRLSNFVKIITFPLHFIPVLGTLVYAYINAPFAGWDLMDMYFDAIHMDDRSQRVEVFGQHGSILNVYKGCCHSSNEYARFGFVCILLESLPVVGPAFFALTNACAAALWACDMESKGGPPSLRLSSSDPKLASQRDTTHVVQ